MIKEIGRISYLIIALGKLIKEGYKLFVISNKGYLYNYLQYFSIQKLEGRLKTKELKDILAIVFKLATNILPKNTILFIDNYFTYIELAIALRDRGITIYRTIKLGRKDLPKLLIKIKKEFIKDILYRVLTIVVQNNVLIVTQQDNNLVLRLTIIYNYREINNSISKKRKRLSKTSTNTRIILSTFKENS